MSVTVQWVIRYHHHLNQNTKSININNNNNFHKENLVGEIQVMAIKFFVTATAQPTAITTNQIIIILQRQGTH